MRNSLFLLIALLLSAAVTALGQGFVKITDTVNPVVNYVPTGKFNGGAWVDVDGDNDLDLFNSPNRLFRNEGSGVFTEIPTIIGNDNTQLPTGTSWADYDNDGDIDCYVAGNPSRLYGNDGSGNFTKLGISPLNDLPYAAWAASFADYDLDGYVDICGAHPADFLGPIYPSFLFKSDGSGGFSRIVDQEFTDSTVLAPYTVPYWTDFDRDGDQDLFIASGPGGVPDFDYCYRNMLKETGVANFERITDLSFAIDMQDGQCYNFVDIDNDRDIDLFITNWTGAPNQLYVNTDGVFTAEDNGLLQPEAALSNGWGDFDNDGDLDVIVTNNQNHSTHLYANDGAGLFTELLSMFPDSLHTSGMSIGDYDNDGDLDVFLGGNETGKALYRNQGIAGTNGWINLTLTGTNSNRSAIGAWIEMKCTIGGEAVWQQRDLLAQNTASGQNSLRVHFGMGDALVADSVIIHWPSGLTEAHTELFPRNFYKLTEGQGGAVGLNNELTSASLHLFPNPAVKLVQIQLPQEYIADAQRFGQVAIYNLQGKLTLSAPYAQSFDISQLSTGIYSVQIQIGEQTLSTTLVVQKATN